MAKKAKKADKFIQGAIKRPGTLTQRAKAAHMSVSAFAKKNFHAKGVVGEESRFYIDVLSKVSRKKKK